MKKATPFGTALTPVGAVLETLVENCRSRTGGRIAQLSHIWEKAVAPPISDNARPFAIRGSLLLVHVSSSPWLHHLQFLKTDLMDTLNRHLSSTPITDIQFRVGRWS